MVSGAHILVVEDDDSLARVIARWLRREGYEVTVAHTAAQARALGGRFHCAVLDIDLPDGKGPDVAEALLDAGSVPRLLFFTATFDVDLRRRAEALGPVVDKTEPLAVLLRAVAATLAGPAEPIALAKVVGVPESRERDGAGEQPESDIRELTRR